MYDLLQQKNKSSAAHAVDLAQRLVRVPSECLQEEPVADMVEREMRSNRFDRVLRDSAGNVVSLKFGREGNPVALLASHMDTVGIGDASSRRTWR